MTLRLKSLWTKQKKNIRRTDNFYQFNYKIMINNILNEIQGNHINEVAIPVDYLTPQEHYAIHKATEELFKNAGGDECCDLCSCLECCC